MNDQQDDLGLPTEEELDRDIRTVAETLPPEELVMIATKILVTIEHFDTGDGIPSRILYGGIQHKVPFHIYALATYLLTHMEMITVSKGVVKITDVGRLYAYLTPVVVEESNS